MKLYYIYQSIQLVNRRIKFCGLLFRASSR